MNAFSLLLVFAVFSMLGIPAVYGHGLGGEILPPIFLEGRDVTLSINVSPSTFDKNDSERYITINLNESKSQAIVEHVTLEFELSKEGKTIFKELFHDDLGNLAIKILTNSGELQIQGDTAPNVDAWMRTATKPVTISGPVFDSGGLYSYKIRIITMDSDNNFLENPPELKGAISLAERNTFEVTDIKQNLKTINLISYFDKIESFEYTSGKIFFLMPFDWNQNFDQLSVVHEEIQIPENFSEFLHTKYEAKINGIMLDEESVTIDDYSSKGRTVHIVASKETLQQIREQATIKSDSKMYFDLGPSQKITLPLEAVTPDLRYRIFLSWEPETIHSGQQVSFLLKIEELFKDKLPKEIRYKVALSHEGKTVLETPVLGSTNSENSDKVSFQFSPEDEGTFKLDIFDIEENPLSKANFLIVVKPQQSQQFPIRMESTQPSGSGNGMYNVDLTWFPNSLGLGESEFVITFYNKNTGLPVRGVSYDFVLIQNGQEIHRKSGFANAGGTFENFVFVEGETGDLTLRIEKIDGTEDFVEIPIRVAPEFPFATSILLGILIFSTILISKTKFVKYYLN